MEEESTMPVSGNKILEGLRAEECIQVMRSMQGKIMTVVGESRVTRERKEEIVRVLKTGLDEAAAILKIDEGPQLELWSSVGETLRHRGIDSGEEWHSYISTMERNGEIVAEICEMLNADVLQVKDEIAALREAVNAGKAVDKGRVYNNSSCVQPTDRGADMLESGKRATGQQYAGVWKRSSASPAIMEPAVDSTGALVSSQLASYLRAMACVDPGVFKGSKSEDFCEFMRWFKRKYQDVVRCEETLMEILHPGAKL
ncbi:unnamed protein product [Nippostrongylus brasiliensis]|uniref:RP-C_C domain-containing protein n=1 Tax=Nippostrongylus brasiliensis TaxID=27835 RepID=A0A0N4XLV6_NIPBR|nr:unnamed protein product [Nippostrongylus brasiliensis]